MKENKMKLYNFRNALSRLEEGLEAPSDNKFRVDVCIKRFEFTYETAKKLLEDALNSLDIFVTNPREVLKQSKKQGFITSLELWDQMRDDRNDTSHEYNYVKTEDIVSRIPAYAEEFRFILEKLSKLNA